MTRRTNLFLVCAFEIALLLFVAAWSAFLLRAPEANAGLFDSYLRGEKGDVIAEVWSTSRNEWDAVVLFFGYVDDWAICQEYLEMLKERDTHRYRCVENK